MLEFGKSLKTAREAKGLSVEQLSESTHMPAKTIRELETEDFTALPAPIYGRGFVKLYCNAVGLEPKPFLDEFMEIYNGNRDLTIRERETDEPDAPASESNPEPIADTPTTDLNDIPPPIADVPPPVSVPLTAKANTIEQMNLIGGDVPPQPAMRAPTFGDEPPAQPTTSRYANPIYNDLVPSRRISVPPAVWRLSLLALIAAGILWGGFVGLKALYRSTCGSTQPLEPEAVTAVADVPAAVSKPADKEKPTAKDKKPADKAEKPATSAKPASSRKPQKIAPLYLD